MLFTRVITGLLLAVVLFYTVSFAHHPLPPLLLFFCFAGVAGVEFVALRWRCLEGPGDLFVQRPKISKEHVFIGLLYGLSIPLVALGNAWVGAKSEAGLAIVFLWMVSCSVALSGWFYLTEKRLHLATSKLINSMAGFVYIAIPAVALFRMNQIEIPGAPQGIAIYFCLSVVLMGDIMAYFGGRLFGKNRLLPRVSPKKTWEGAAFGLLASGLTGTGIAWFFQFGVPYWFVFLVCVFAGCAGQIGDLVASALKRVANCKDSSGLLPGHGGALDRIDAVIVGAPLCILIFLVREFGFF